MVKMRLKKDDKATTGKLFHIDVAKEDAFEAILQAEGKEIANNCALYGWRVFLQKDVAEAGGGDTGRDWELVAKHLDDAGVSYTTSEWVKGEKVEDPKLALVKGLSLEELTALVAKAKAGQ